MFHRSTVLGLIAISAGCSSAAPGGDGASPNAEQGTSAGVSSPEDSTGSPGGSNVSDGGSTDNTVAIDTSKGGSSATATDCDKETTYVYLVDGAKTLWRFNPGDLSTEKRTQLECPGAGAAQPASMSIARDGTAWVLYTNGSVYSVSVLQPNQPCQSTRVNPNQIGYHLGYNTGIAFVALGQGSSQEALFIAGPLGTTTNSSVQLGKMDEQSLVITRVGDVHVAGMDLTGSGDGKLYGFMYNAGATKIGELDRTAGSVVGTPGTPNVALSGTAACICVLGWRPLAFQRKGRRPFVGIEVRVGVRPEHDRPSRYWFPGPWCRRVDLRADRARALSRAADRWEEHDATS
jgi:hypothetical protein